MRKFIAIVALIGLIALYFHFHGGGDLPKIPDISLNLPGLSSNTSVGGGASDTSVGQPMPVISWGDQGNGTYKNPILYADYSDPDIVRHGDDFYLVASDFHFMGIQILHSRDLVNWQVINQIFHRLDVDPKYDQMKAYGEGTWAPSIRFHNGEFYVYVCTPQDGLFMWHTSDPAGTWSDTVTVKKVPLWEDPCPFWDDDGKAYLFHSRKGAGPIILHAMSADGTKLLDEGKEIYRGQTAEGPKVYKRHGYYYISLPERGVSNGCQVVLRSKNIFGPYDRREVLPDGSPHQGGMVDLDNGQSWFISFKSTGFSGRICYLNPVTWGTDDWPVFGDNGKPVDVWKKPDVGKISVVSRPQTSDEFDSLSLSPIWQWNHNPIDENWSLLVHPGYLRLRTSPATSENQARNTLTQKLWDNSGTIDAKLDASSLVDGQKSGLVFMSGGVLTWVGPTQLAGVRRVSWRSGIGPVLKSNDLWVRGTYQGDQARLLYSLDGNQYVDTGQSVKLSFLNWKGARVGLMAYGPKGGALDVDYFRYSYGK